MVKLRVGTLEMILQRTAPAFDFMPFCERVARGVLGRFLSFSRLEYAKRTFTKTGLTQTSR